jgi:CheY-like chemotaxis protein
MRIDEATSVASAEQRLMIKRYDGLLLSMDETDTALALLARLRAGGLPAPARLPVLVMAASCDAVLAAELKRHEVRRVLIKPFKAKTLLQSIEVLALEPADSPLA